MSQQTKIKGIADIVFLLDATGSMQPCIEGVKTNIETFITRLTTKDANNQSPVREWRARVVGYRDFNYNDHPPLVDHPFVSDVERLRGQLAAMEAAGGGDEPESLLEGLYYLATLQAAGPGEPADSEKWRDRSEARRFVIVFTDATYHPTMTRPAGGTVEDVINALTSARIILHLFAPDFPCYTTLAEVDKAEWNVVDGGDGPQDSLRKYTTDQAHFQKIIDQLAKTLSQEAAVPLA